MKIAIGCDHAGCDMKDTIIIIAELAIKYALAPMLLSASFNKTAVVGSPFATTSFLIITALSSFTAPYTSITAAITAVKIDKQIAETINTTAEKATSVALIATDFSQSERLTLNFIICS